MFPSEAAIETNDVGLDGVIFGLASMIIAAVVLLFLIRLFVDYRKAKLAAAHDQQVRQLVSRYEQLASSTLDAQQRTAADLADVRARVTSVEQVLRTVDQG